MCAESSFKGSHFNRTERDITERVMSLQTRKPVRQRTTIFVMHTTFIILLEIAYFQDYSVSPLSDPRTRYTLPSTILVRIPLNKNVPRTNEERSHSVEEGCRTSKNIRKYRNLSRLIEFKYLNILALR